MIPTYTDGGSHLLLTSAPLLLLGEVRGVAVPHGPMGKGKKAAKHQSGGGTRGGLRTESTIYIAPPRSISDFFCTVFSFFGGPLYWRFTARQRRWIGRPPCAPGAMAELLFQAVCAGKKVVEMVENAKECEAEAIQVAGRCVFTNLRMCSPARIPRRRAVRFRRQPLSHRLHVAWATHYFLPHQGTMCNNP